MKNRQSKIFIIIVILLSIATIVFSHYMPQMAFSVRNVFSSFIVPVQKGINNVGMIFVKRSMDSTDLKEANERIRILEAEVASLSETNGVLRAKSYEADRLRELYGLSDEYDQYKKIAARVIAKDTDEWFQVFKIDKGTRDGVKVDMNVLSSKGLCGIVTSVGYNYAIVRSIIDDESRVSAMTEHSLESCMVEGDITLYKNNRLRITGIDMNAAIVDGDKIVTSNISSKFLPNILIGYANDVTVNENQLSKSGYIIPVTDFKNITEVLVITQLKSDSMRDN
ncbi:MAG: rod shape-determining protein MreC [Lachnospiraceae bacterium]|nr:rod shape-determining protein MreC [Lachnospiraceae bacterium]